MTVGSAGRAESSVRPPKRRSARNEASRTIDWARVLVPLSLYAYSGYLGAPPPCFQQLPFRTPVIRQAQLPNQQPRRDMRPHPKRRCRKHIGQRPCGNPLGFVTQPRSAARYRRHRRPLVPLGLPLLVSISRGRDPQSKREAPVNQNTIYIGIDVDDVRYHGSALNPSTGEMLDFDCRPALKGSPQPGSVCSVNTLQPCCGPPAIR